MICNDYKTRQGYYKIKNGLLLDRPLFVLTLYCLRLFSAAGARRIVRSENRQTIINFRMSGPTQFVEFTRRQPSRMPVNEFFCLLGDLRFGEKKSLAVIAAKI